MNDRSYLDFIIDPLQKLKAFAMNEPHDNLKRLLFVIASVLIDIAVKSYATGKVDEEIMIIWITHLKNHNRLMERMEQKAKSIVVKQQLKEFSLEDATKLIQDIIDNETTKGD